VLKRIVLFLLTNLAIVFVLNISLRILGVDRLIAQSGGSLTSWLLFAAIVGFAGSLFSLAVSKWSAKMMTGAQVIRQASNGTERWLLDTVGRHAQRAGIGMPEVAIYDSPEINAFATGWNRNAALVAVSSGLLQRMTATKSVTWPTVTW
jgi:heat shock protein HtpX